MSKEPEVKARRQAMIGKVHCIEVEAGTVIFDLVTEKPLGRVEDRKPVVYGDSVYLSVNDYSAAKAALPAAPMILPGLPTRH